MFSSSLALYVTLECIKFLHLSNQCSVVLRYLGINLKITINMQSLDYTKKEIQGFEDLIERLILFLFV